MLHKLSKDCYDIVPVSSEFNKQELAKLIGFFRVRAGMDFSKLSKATGVHPTTVSRWEDLRKPEVRPSERNCRLIANALRLNRDETDKLIEVAGHPKLDEAMVKRGEKMAEEAFPLLFGRESARRFLFELNQKMKTAPDTEIEQAIAALRTYVRGIGQNG